MHFVIGEDDFFHKIEKSWKSFDEIENVFSDGLLRNTELSEKTWTFVRRKFLLNGKQHTALL